MSLEDLENEYPHGLMPEWATGRCNNWCVGAQLRTKDGRRCGNAVIAEAVINVLRREASWLVFTDAGSQMILNEKELAELFYWPEWVMLVGSAPGYERWRSKANVRP